MRVLTNTTSPYARIARIALGEKGFDLSQTMIVNPWNDDPALLALNSAARVPTLQTDEGLPITESLLVLLWLEKKVPEPSLLAGPLDRTISLAGRAMGVIDAMANIVTNRMQVDPQFGEHRVGLRRRRTIVEGFRALEADPPAYDAGTPDIAVITAIVALDYLNLRFAGEPWVEPLPRLAALREAVAARPAFAATEPYV
jgi:glutathione S-transferase